MKKIFLSGPVAGMIYADAVKDFNDAEKLLQDKGYQVINPVSFIHPDSDWAEAMRLCIKELKKCDAIYMLKGYENSKGASVEHCIARELNLEVIYQHDYETADTGLD